MAQAQVRGMSETVIAPNDQCPATVDVEGETVRCWRWLNHHGPHMAPDGIRWTDAARPPARTYARADRMAEQIAALAGRLEELEQLIAEVSPLLADELEQTWQRLATLEAAQRCPSAPQSDATRPDGQRVPVNPADDYPPYPQAPKVDA